MRNKSEIDTRKRIVEAAILIAAQSGFTKTTTKEIAKKAKSSEGIIYHYFKSKHELFLATIKESAEEFLGELQTQINTGSDAKMQLESLVNFHFKYFTGKRHIFQILFGKSGDAMVPFSHVLKTVILPYQKVVAGIIEKGIKSGDFQQVNVVIAASSILGMMQFNIIKLHFGVGSASIEETKDTVKKLIFRVLL